MARSGSPSRSPSSRRRRAASPGIRIRMYRQGFGDCLLVDLPGADGKPFRLMIDCGVLWGTPDATKRMRDIVSDIAAETGGWVDVLVVTHEHWDHVSGFHQAKDLFAPAGTDPKPGQVRFGEVWLAWTEDPDDELAKKLGKERKDQRDALAGLVDALGASARPSTARLQSGLTEVLGFFGFAANDTSSALTFARSLGPARYIRPADPPWEDARAPGIRIFALGPPPDEKLIRRLQSSTELYHGFAGDLLAEAFRVSVASRFGLDDAAAQQRELYYPFDRAFRMPLDADGTDDGVHDPADRKALDRLLDRHYRADADGWRRIDDDWLGGASELALHLDSATNNTSLVLAIEVEATGQVLLFVGDAQLGNWLSWQALVWKRPDGSRVTGPDLLARTVFYKVGHHGSHNATLKAKGLEQMARKDFVAFVPVDEAIARSRTWNRIPLASLMQALGERGFVARADTGEVAGGPHARPPGYRETELYLEYVLPLPA